MQYELYQIGKGDFFFNVNMAIPRRETSHFIAPTTYVIWAKWTVNFYRSA
jgi:hypothetical protein